MRMAKILLCAFQVVCYMYYYNYYVLCIIIICKRVGRLSELAWCKMSTLKLVQYCTTHQLKVNKFWIWSSYNAWQPSIITCNHFYTGIPYSQWKGAYIRNGVALLACVAINGFHSVTTTYKWSRDGYVMQGENYPVVYVEVPGIYGCVITVPSNSVNTTSVFQVTTG